jgi:SRSO17 transposase
VCFGPRGTRLRVEESFQIAKNEAGLDQYQVRRYDAWYAHITLSMAAAAFMTVVRAAETEKGAPPAANIRAA